MAGVRFYRGEFGEPQGDLGGEGRLAQLVSGVTSDVQNFAPDCLDLMARVEDVRSGRSTQDEWEGNSCSYGIEPGGVTVTPLVPWGVRYPVRAR